MILPARYRLGARWYDRLSLESVLYRHGRRCGIELAGLRPGDRVLDVGCGTGLSFAPVIDAIGSNGSIVGVDASAPMLSQALARVARHGWHNVRLHRGDARGLPAGPYDVVLFCYSLSIVDGWRGVWLDAVNRLAPGGRIVVVDTAYPTGAARWLAPLVWVFLTLGGVHPRRRVWELVDNLAGVQRRTLEAGHVHVAVGSIT